MILHEEYQRRADSVLRMVTLQLFRVQESLDASFADLITVEYDLDRLSTEFGTSVRFLLRAFTAARSRLPADCAVTANHRLRALLKPTLVLTSSDVSNSSDQSDVEVPHA